jgi:hypothetical protein
MVDGDEAHAAAAACDRVDIGVAFVLRRSGCDWKRAR